MAKKALKNKQARPQKFSTREYTRCTICGRPHAVLKKYGICTIGALKENKRGSNFGTEKPHIGQV